MRFTHGPRARYRWAVASRIVAGSVGGYALAAICTASLSVALPFSRVEATLTAMMLSFAIYAGAAIWCFAATTATRAWIGLAIPSIAFGMLLLFVRLANAPP